MVVSSVYCEVAEFVDGKFAAATAVAVEGRLATMVAEVEGAAESATPSTLTFCNWASEFTEPLEPAPSVSAPMR